MSTTISPQRIYDYINQYVVGQEEAKRTVSLSVFVHFVKCFCYYTTGEYLRPSHTLLLGPSGSGKSYMVKRAAQAIDVLTTYNIGSVYEIDCTALTATGWTGNNIEDLLKNYYNDIKDPLRFATSIIFLDEVDKICTVLKNSEGSDFNKQTQYCLLKILEGMNIHNKIDRSGFSTERMLFVLAGNFPQIRHARSAKSIGFTSIDASQDAVIQNELEKAGMVTQLIGRIAIVTELNELTKDELKQILTCTKQNIYEEYSALFDYLKTDLILSDKQIDDVVDRCYQNKTGVRGLQMAIHEEVSKQLFNLDFEI